jgi:hypothetical protein
MKTSPGTQPVRIHRTFKLLGISVGATALLVAHSARAIETGEGDGGYSVCASCPTEGWSSDPLSANSIEDHLTAMCCLRHLAEYIGGSQYYFGVCDFGAYDWDCAQYGGVQDDGSPGCPGSGLFAQRWIAFFGFDQPPTSANYTGDAMGTCGSIDVMGFRYQ